MVPVVEVEVVVGALGALALALTEGALALGLAEGM